MQVLMGKFGTLGDQSVSKSVRIGINVTGLFSVLPCCLCNSLRCRIAGTFCYGISRHVIILAAVSGLVTCDEAHQARSTLGLCSTLLLSGGFSFLVCLVVLT